MEFKKGLESPGQVVRACTMICGVQKQVGKPQNCRQCKDASDIGKQMDGWIGASFLGFGVPYFNTFS